MMRVFIDDDVLRKIANVIAGKEAEQVVMALRKYKEATDDQILAYIKEQVETEIKLTDVISDHAETEIKLNDVRKILFKLFNHSIVQCDRKRDENTGWFIFRWRLQPDQVEGFVKNQKKRILKILKTRLNYEQKHTFYYCYTPECKRLTFEDAMEYVFKCPTCGKALDAFNNDKIINSLKEKINQLENN